MHSSKDKGQREENDVGINGNIQYKIPIMKTPSYI